VALLIKHRHSWNLTPQEARRLQEELREKWEGRDRLGTIRTVAGVDAAFVIEASQALSCGSRRATQNANQAIAGVIVYRFPEMEELERVWAVRPLQFPYVPGLLSFREIPVLLAALETLRQMPDLIFCDAHGYAHPRRFGLASHLGVLLDLPTIGCAKSLLTGKETELGREGGAWSPVVDADVRGVEEVICAAVRTREGARPVYVSQGHRVSLKSAIRLALDVSDGYRIPRPTREADHYVSAMKRERVHTAERNLDHPLNLPS
jgi:deoxyribonuclease V